MTCLRIFGIFGRYDDYRFKFISNAILKNIIKMPITISQNVVFDYLYIDDFMEILAGVIKKQPRSKHINVTPTKSIDLISIANLINEVSDYKSEIKVLHSGMNSEYSGDNSRLLSEFPHLKFTEYKDSIGSLYKYYTTYLDSIDVDVVREDPYLKHCTYKDETKTNA